MVDRVRRPKEFEDFMTQLTAHENIFKTYKDVLVFAACLGYNRKKRQQFKQTSEPIHLHVFSGNYDQMVLNVLAIAETNDPYIMSKGRESEKIKIFEEYACGGLEIMKNEFGYGTLAIEEGLVHAILNEQRDTPTLHDIANIGNFD